MCACGREVRLGFACGCVLERVVCRVRFARVSCPWLRFGYLEARPSLKFEFDFDLT